MSKFKENDILYILERQDYKFSAVTFEPIIPYKDLLFSVIKMKVVNEKGTLKLRSLEKIYVPLNSFKFNKFDGAPLSQVCSIDSIKNNKIIFNSRREAEQYYYDEKEKLEESIKQEKEKLVKYHEIMLNTSLSEDEKFKRFTETFSINNQSDEEITRIKRIIKSFSNSNKTVNNF